MPEAKSSLDGLEVYRVRDDLARTYNPTSPLERMLVTQLAQSWIRLQQAYDVERRYQQGRDMLEIVLNKRAEFKVIAAYVSNCERSWNRALLNLQKAQQERKRESLASPNARRAHDRPPVQRTAAAGTSQAEVVAEPLLHRRE